MTDKVICLLIGPGTLPSRGVDRMDLVRYAEWKSGRKPMTGQELLAELPEVAKIAQVEVDGGNPYDHASFNGLRALAMRINALVQRGDVAGVIFVQGTNNIEETAYFLNLTVRTKKPVIVTGAQRPFTGMSSDAQLNFIDAVRVASSDAAAGMGVVVVANSEINAARDVTKSNTYRLQTFRSRDLGILGYSDGDGVVFYRRPVRKHTSESEFDVARMESMPRVDVLYVMTGVRPDLARAAVNLGARGLVIAGSGAGSTGDLRKELAAIAGEGVVVVRSARVGDGRVIRDDNWNEPGMVAADNLSPQKAAILLTLALGVTKDPDAIQRMFDTY